MKLAKRHRWWILGAIIVVLAGTLAAYFSSPRRYTASASVWLDHRLDQVVAEGGGSSRAGDAALRRNTEVRFLTSPAVVARVVDKLGLADLRGTGQPDTAPAVPLDQARRRAIASLIDGMKVKATGASYAVVASYTANDAVVATGIVNQLVDQYVAYRRDDGARERGLQQLRGVADAARDEMIRARAAAHAYRVATNLIGSDEDVERLRREVATLHAQLAEVRFRNATPGGKVLANGPKSRTLRDWRAQLTQLTAQRKELQERSAPPGSEVAAVNARIADVRREIAKETKRIGDQGAYSRGAQDSADARLAASSKVAAQRNRLDATASVARERYDSVVEDLRRSEAAPPASAGGYIISRASIPSAPESPNPWTFVAAGLLAALLAVGAVILVRELLAPGFRTRQAAERKLGIPVIGMVPDISEIPGAVQSGIDPIDLVVANGRSNFAAAFKSIQAGLGLGRGAQSPRCVAVSSAVAEEGKTTVSIGLARTAALAGLRVLLIDCDVRRPAASKALAPDAAAGLPDVLQGKVELKQALTRDAPSGAWFLPSIEDEEPATWLVGSEAMMKLIASLTHDYDLVILDTAPVLALVETRVAARFADSMLLVARWRKTPIGATQIALDLLKEAGAKVAGLALTRVGA